MQNGQSARKLVVQDSRLAEHEVIDNIGIEESKLSEVTLQQMQERLEMIDDIIVRESFVHGYHDRRQAIA